MVRRGAAAVLLAVVAVWTLWISVRLAPPILYDDAAISMRYAERIASGAGFTYNDNEHVSGASNPLWTLLIAAGIRAGFGAERTTRGLTTISLAAAVTVAALLVLQIAGPFAAFAVGFLLPVDGVWRTQVLSGLELPLALALGFAAVLAAANRRQVVAGVLVGLAIVNKLDAAALALALVIAWMYLHRELPLRLCAVAAALPIVWLVFAALYFGSPLPHSMVTKLQQGEAAAFSRLWVLDFFLTDWRYLLLMAAACVLPTFSRANAKRAMAVVALCAWAVIHALAYSLIPLGDQYPWYLGVPTAVAMVVGGVALSVPAPLSIAAGMAIFAAMLPHARETTIHMVSDHQPEVWEAFDSDRRLAGIYLSQFAERDAIVEAGSGWVAFESRRAFVDSTGLNSVKEREPDYLVLHGVPWQTGSHEPVQPPDYVPLARFDLASKLYPGTTWFIVYGHQASAIARGGWNETAVDVSRLDNDALEQLWQEHHPKASDAIGRAIERDQRPQDQ